MFILIDEKESFVILFKEKDEVLRFISEEKRFVSTTSPRNWDIRGFIYNPYEDEDWEKSVFELFGMRIEPVEFGVEVEI